MDRYYYKKICGRSRIFDRTEVVGTNHMCIADCSDEWRAKVIVHEMNNGLPYRPDITYDDYVKLRSEGAYDRKVLNQYGHIV